jgi:voltage-gated potassium channel
MSELAPAPRERHAFCPACLRPLPRPTTGDEAETDTVGRLVRERRALLTEVETWLDAPMLALAFVWLALLVVELVRGLTPALEALGTAIWIVFVVDFVVRVSIAPAKLDFLRANWLTEIALMLPALRLVRIVRVVRLVRLGRAARGLRLLRLLTSLNRGMRALRGIMGRRRFGYVVGLTVIVTLAGAAGMYAIEERQIFASYGDALWWTAMLMTTMGSDAWPRTAEGRVLCVGLALYAFAVFGYLTATLASFFVAQDARRAAAGDDAA